VGQGRKKGKRKTILIVAEGAIDSDLQPISPNYLKDLLSKKLGLDTRITTLGHTQRGGVPCAFDRYLATVQGVEAVKAILESTPDTPSPMIGIRENKITRTPLVDAVKLVSPGPPLFFASDGFRPTKLPKQSIKRTFAAQWNCATPNSKNTSRRINAPPSPNPPSTSRSPKKGISALQSCTSVRRQEV